MFSNAAPYRTCICAGVNMADSLEPDDYDDDDDDELMRGPGMGMGLGGDDEALRSYMLDHAMMLDSADAHANGTLGLGYSIDCLTN